MTLVAVGTVNAQAPPRQLLQQGPGFRTWAARSARQNSPNLTCFAWPAYLVRRRPGRPDYLRTRVGDSDFVGETCCSFDYLALCKDGHACATDRHAFSLDVVDESGVKPWTYRYNACPRRISVLVQTGQRYDTRGYSKTAHRAESPRTRG